MYIFALCISSTHRHWSEVQHHLLDTNGVLFGPKAKLLLEVDGPKRPVVALDVGVAAPNRPPVPAAIGLVGPFLPAW